MHKTWSAEDHPDLTILSDLELVEQFRARRDDQTARILVERLYPTIRARCLHLLRNRDNSAGIDAGDIALKVIGRLVRRLTAPRPIVNFDAWLNALVRNSVFDALRKEASNQRSHTTIWDEQPALEDAGASPDTRADRSDRLQQAISALQKLTPADQQIVATMMGEGLTVSEAAQLLGMSTSALRVRHHRILKKLRQILSEKLTDAGA